MGEEAIISGVAADHSEARVTIVGAPDRPGIAAMLFRPVADEGVNVDMIVQQTSHDGRTDVSFLVPKDDLPRVSTLAENLVRQIGAERFETDGGVAKVSLVGAGIKTHPSVLADLFEALADEGINIEMITTTSIRISCVVRAQDEDRAVRAVHRRFAIAEGTAAREEHTGENPVIAAPGPEDPS